MSIVAVGSCHGSPGVTTLVVALATVWTRSGRRALVVEADPDGGVLAARHGLCHHPSLTDLAVRARGPLDHDDVVAVAQTMPGGVPIVVAHASPDQCQATLRNGAEAVADRLRTLPGHDAVVDVGRIRPRSPAAAFVDTADAVVVVLHPSLDEVAVASARLATLARGERVALVLAGQSPYRAGEVEDVLQAPVIGVLPARRNTLVRAVRPLAAALVRRLDARPEPA